ncbi:hypothetical protein ACH41H_40595 [Streptomyces sp. NPDC020800]
MAPPLSGSVVVTGAGCPRPPRESYWPGQAPGVVVTEFDSPARPRAPW